MSYSPFVPVPTSSFVGLDAAVRRAIENGGGLLVLIAGPEPTVVQATLFRLSLLHRDGAVRIAPRTASVTKPTGVDLDDLMATWYTYCRSAGAVVLVETTAEVTSTARVLLGHLRNVLAIDLASLCSDDLVHGPRPLRPDLAEHLMAHCGGDPFAIDQTFRSMQRNRTVQYNRRTGQWEIISESPPFKRRPSVTAASISAPDGPCDDTRISQQLDDPAIVIDLTKIDGVPPSAEWADILANAAWRALDGANPTESLRLLDAAHGVMVALSEFPPQLAFKIGRYRALTHFALSEFHAATRCLIAAIEDLDQSRTVARRYRTALAKSCEEVAWAYELSGRFFEARFWYGEALQRYRAIPPSTSLLQETTGAGLARSTTRFEILDEFLALSTATGAVIRQ